MSRPFSRTTAFGNLYCVHFCTKTSETKYSVWFLFYFPLYVTNLAEVNFLKIFNVVFTYIC